MSHLDLPDHDSEACAFCAYLSGRRAYAIVDRSPLVAILITREPRGYPHALVVTVRHCPTILEVTDQEAAELLMAVREVARAIDVAFERPGISIWQNNGVPAHQVIGHLHVHVAGTLDGAGTLWGEVEERPLEDAESVADRLRPHLLRWS
jgi:histidine triad (HIT) family protein